MVLVHGAMDRSAGMLRLSRQLDHEWEVIRYDRRGYGRSRPSDGPFTVDAHVDDLLGLVDGRPSVLVGHSFGGNVVLALADRHPDLVRAVVVYESPMSWVDWWPADSVGNLAVSMGGDPADAAEQFLRRMIGNRRWEKLPPSTREARRAEGVAVVAELADLARQAPWSPERIKAPVLTVYGERGRDHHRRAMRAIAEAVPDGRVTMLAGAHHFGVNTDAVATAALISAFLDDVLG